MKAHLLHNPKAGDKDHSENELKKQITAHGFRCIYSNVKKDWIKELTPDTDFVIIAGGDGTVRKVILEFLNGKAADKRYPIALLPMGTANNISRSLNLRDDAEHIIESWHQQHMQKFDVGRIAGFHEEMFFLEGFGFGVFPVLMAAMKQLEEPEEPEEKMKMALETLHDVIDDYTARECRLEIDGVDHSGKYLMVEVMNIRSIGPGLTLNADAAVGDGEMEVILLGEDKRKGFAAYIRDRITSAADKDYDLPVIKGKSIKISWEDEHAHIDDELIKAGKGKSYIVSILKRELDFLVPA
ncbi:diacylglycerol/lipid kinase family protein [Chitinophaga ginsengisoli]|uniref:Diacylglycerol kinase family enzyme n=1 Tax=Chitinophaga ginsengisoli TaxID=363837 RepID=A0A2P8FI97_9BACT|nr:diacylglycerol kinase family protein [Chitinophaga ginsengisoli]PSL21449.1 diacylglycerol kinase family enzyme [Chitinophaga ginsengisoli]